MEEVSDNGLDERERSVVGSNLQDASTLEEVLIENDTRAIMEPLKIEVPQLFCQD